MIFNDAQWYYSFIVNGTNFPGYNLAIHINNLKNKFFLIPLPGIPNNEMMYKTDKFKYKDSLKNITLKTTKCLTSGK